MIFVFDFRLGQRGLVVDAPIGGAQALVYKSVFKEFVERLQND